MRPVPRLSLTLVPHVGKSFFRHERSDYARVHPTIAYTCVGIFSRVAAGRGSGACPPLFRTGYLYIHRIVTRAWVGRGAVCTGLMGDGKESGGFLLRAGLANGTDAAAGAKYGFPPCLEFAHLRAPGGPWELTKEHLATLGELARAEFHAHVG